MKTPQRQARAFLEAGLEKHGFVVLFFNGEKRTGDLEFTPWQAFQLEGPLVCIGPATRAERTTFLKEYKRARNNKKTPSTRGWLAYKFGRGKE